MYDVEEDWPSFSLIQSSHFAAPRALSATLHIHSVVAPALSATPLTLFVVPREKAPTKI